MIRVQEQHNLTNAEASRLQQCETVIERGLSVFIDVGRALAEIRDGKLYRAAYKTFEAYCQERWHVSRPRAYELIGIADVVSAIEQAGGVLSDASDISTRAARDLKRDLPAVTEEIHSRIEKGEDPAEVTYQVLEARKVDPAQKEDRTDRRPATPQGGLTRDDELAEKDEAIKFLEGEVERLNAKLKTYERLDLMFREWTEGGWEKVVQAKDNLIEELQRTAQARIATESADKASWAKSAKAGWKKAKEHGYSRDEVIDLG